MTVIQKEKLDFLDSFKHIPTTPITHSEGKTLRMNLKPPETENQAEIARIKEELEHALDAKEQAVRMNTNLENENKKLDVRISSKTRDQRQVKGWLENNRLIRGGYHGQEPGIEEKV